MKTIKQITAAILIISAIVSLSTCKNIIIQTDKPLYDVLTSHVWKHSSNDYYYHFFTDSTCNYNADINVNNTSNYENFSIIWWVEDFENTTEFHIKDIQISDGDTIWNDVKYIVEKYDEYKIKTYYKVVPHPDEIPCNDSFKVIFKAVN